MDFDMKTISGIGRAQNEIVVLTKVNFAHAGFKESISSFTSVTDRGNLATERLFPKLLQILGFFKSTFCKPSGFVFVRIIFTFQAWAYSVLLKHVRSHHSTLYL
jgi:hypothetical protein